MLSSGRSPTESGRVCTSAFPSSSYPHRADGGEAAALPSHRPALRPAWDRRSPFLRPPSGLQMDLLPSHRLSFLPFLPPSPTPWSVEALRVPRGPALPWVVIHLCLRSSREDHRGVCASARGLGHASSVRAAAAASPPRLVVAVLLLFTLGNVGSGTRRA